MTEKGYRVLSYLLAHYDKALIAQVVGARDKNLAQDFYEEIQALCAQEGIRFYNRSQSLLVASDFSLAVSWRWLIKEAATLIVLHDSLLPRYRGFAPLVNALINGEPVIGVTALFANAEFDRGDIVTQAARPVPYPIKIAQAIELSVECYLEVVGYVLQQLSQGQALEATAQREEEATYSLWRDDEDYAVDWSQSSGYLKRFVDAVGWPYRGASTRVNGQLCRVVEAEVVPDVFIENRTAGKVLFMNEGQPVVVCGTGLLRVTDLRNEANQQVLPLTQFRTRFA
jgi:methionyl-tRNA formyltransferase